MPGSRINPMRRLLPETVRRRLEIATAMAWEAVVETHVANAQHFAAMMRGRLPLEDAIARYAGEMDVPGAVESAFSTRILAAADAFAGDDDGPLAIPFDAGEDAGDTDSWRRFRPDVMVRSVLERQRRAEDDERWIQLLIARAEEGLILTHVENSVTFTALLEGHFAQDRAVLEYLDAMNLRGGRAQTVFQRAMARLADAYLPAPAPRPAARPPGRAAPRPAPPGS
jgi:hypothetical protein